MLNRHLNVNQELRISHDHSPFSRCFPLLLNWEEIVIFSQFFYTTERKTMQITFERTGGFAGITRKKTVDAATLAPNDAKELHQLVEVADLFNLPAQIPSPNPQSDRFQYRLTLEDNGTQHTVVVSEAALPGTLRPLIEWLNNAAVQR
jgi:hypothetical protein